MAEVEAEGTPSGIPDRDFTAERRTWPEWSNEEIQADALRIAEEDLADGWLDGKTIIQC